MRKEGAGNFSNIVLKKRDNKGSHVGMILSFAIFITFITFLYVVIKPVVNTEQDKKTILEYIEREIILNMSTNLTSVSITVTKNTGKSCILIENFLLIPEMNPPYIITKNIEAGDVEIIYQDLAHLVIDRKVKEYVKFKVYYSPEFPLLNPNPLPQSQCAKIQETDYTLGILKTRRYIFENKITQLKTHYNEDYEALKDALKIPLGNEWGFSFILEGGTEIETEKEIGSANIYIRKIPIQYIDSDANILSGFINIKVW